MSIWGSYVGYAMITIPGPPLPATTRYSTVLLSLVTVKVLGPRARKV